MKSTIGAIAFISALAGKLNPRAGFPWKDRIWGFWQNSFNVGQDKESSRNLASGIGMGSGVAVGLGVEVGSGVGDLGMNVGSGVAQLV